MTPAAAGGGRVAAVFVKPGSGSPVARADAVELVAGVGIAGDANADPGSERQVLLVSEEEEKWLGLGAGDLRENITTRGIAIDSVPAGTQVALGPEAVVTVTGPCEPCSFIARVTGIPKLRMAGRRGTLGVVVRGGRVRGGDSVELLSGGKADAGGAGGAGQADRPPGRRP